MRIKLIMPRSTTRAVDSAWKPYMAPPLALLTLAALTPPEHTVTVHDEFSRLACALGRLVGMRRLARLAAWIAYPGRRTRAMEAPTVLPVMRPSAVYARPTAH